MLIDYFAERTSELDLVNISTEFKDTLKSIALFNWPKMLFVNIDGNALVILDRCSRQVSFGHSTRGPAGAMFRQQDIWNSVSEDITKTFKNNPSASFDEIDNISKNGLLQCMKDNFGHVEDNRIRRFCANNTCAIVSPDLLCCGRCKVTYYCTKECQLMHWKASHKRLCKARV